VRRDEEEGKTVTNKGGVMIIRTGALVIFMNDKGRLAYRRAEPGHELSGAVAVERGTIVGDEIIVAPRRSRITKTIKQGR
jgi:hypothetical protein